MTLAALGVLVMFCFMTHDKVFGLHDLFTIVCVLWTFPLCKTKIMASSPITTWQIGGETVADFILGGSKITADGDCSHEIKRHLFLGRKAMTNPESILKSRDLRNSIGNKQKSTAF